MLKFHRYPTITMQVPKISKKELVKKSAVIGITLSQTCKDGECEHLIVTTFVQLTLKFVTEWGSYCTHTRSSYNHHMISYSREEKEYMHILDSENTLN
jgi:hypothetical protein